MAASAWSFVTSGTHSIGLIHAAVAALAIATVLTAGVISLSQREAALTAARQNNHRLATVLAAQTERLLQAVDLVLAGIARDAELDKLTTPEQFRAELSSRAWHDELVSRLAGLPQAAWISVVGADGKLANASLSWPPPPFDATDRPYFQAIRRDASPVLAISEPTVSRLGNGVRMVLFIRRISAPDGRFLGMLTATVLLPYIESFYAALDLPPGMRVTLLRRDGLYLTSFPAYDNSAASRFQPNDDWHRSVAAGGGEFWGNGAQDGLVRLISVEPVAGFPVVIDVGITRTALFADWWNKLAGSGLVVVFALAGLAGLLWVVLIQYNRLTTANYVLDRSERRFRSLTATAQDAIITVNADGLIGEWNHAAERMFGYAKHEALGRDIHDLLAPPDARERAHLRLSRARPSGEANALGTTIEMTALRKDGTEIAIELSLANAQIGSDRETVGIARDITDRKRAEQALAAANEELAQQALTDGLTGLTNRRQFDQALQREWRRAARDVSPLSLLLLDADCFKLYNDRYGHPMGDEVLRQVGANIQANLKRSGDVGARYGGEEFAVILPNTNPDGAFEVAEAIRNGVAARRLVHADGPEGIVTVSIGAASVIPSSDTNLASLVAEADQALYAAKSGGRNRTRSARAMGPAAGMVWSQ